MENNKNKHIEDIEIPRTSTSILHICPKCIEQSLKSSSFCNGTNVQYCVDLNCDYRVETKKEISLTKAQKEILTMLKEPNRVLFDNIFRGGTLHDYSGKHCAVLMQNIRKDTIEKLEEEGLIAFYKMDCARSRYGLTKEGMELCLK